jgi:histidinol phosphatase-like enzyme
MDYACTEMITQLEDGDKFRKFNNIMQEVLQDQAMKLLIIHYHPYYNNKQEEEERPKIM